MSDRPSPFAPDSVAISRLALSATATVCAICWALSHGYQGVVHDARLYSLQALAHLSPLSLTQDVFLKFGSQDRFTASTPAVSFLASSIGIEPAAALVTLFSQFALFVSAWTLARRVTIGRMSFLGLCVFVAIPAEYGADRVFTCIESFMTPRMMAEALILVSLSFALDQRKRLAVVCAAAAASLHPIMALAGALALPWLICETRRSRAVTLLTFGAGAALATLAFPLSGGPWAQFDPHWLMLVKDRSPFLFLEYWTLDDWSGVAVPAATLAMAAIAIPNPKGRALAKAALFTSIIGLTLTFIPCDLFHLVRFAQAQPWRCQWLTTIVAALLLPELLRCFWGGGALRRASALLLAAAWVFGVNGYGLVASAIALASMSLPQKLKPNEARWVLYGSYCLLIIALIWRILSDVQFTESYYLDASIPRWIRRAMSLTRDGTVPMTAIASILLLDRHRRARLGLMLLTTLLCASAVALIPQTWRDWTLREFTAPEIARFSSVRAQIPPGSDVFWPEAPVGSWILLDRPSYLSVVQTSGMVFSRESAMELDRRANLLSSVMGTATFMRWDARSGGGLNLSPTQLRQACGTGAFEFMMSSFDLGIPPLATASGLPGTLSKSTHLYRCRA